MTWITRLNTNRFSQYLAIALAALMIIAAVGGAWLNLTHHQVSEIPIALVAPISGTEAKAGQEMVQSVQLYLDAVNQKGGINGHSLKLLTFDDQANAMVAEKRAQDIVNSPAVVLLGHRSSEPSTVSAPIYNKSHLPTITGTANTDSLTLEHPYYFRNTYTVSMVGEVLSIYAQQALKFQTASIIEYDAYGKKLTKQFSKAFKASGGTIEHVWDISTDKPIESIQTIVKALAADPNAGIVYLSMRSEEQAEAILVALKRRGLTPPIIVSQPLSREGFADRFQQHDEEKRSPGFFTNGVYATSPLLFDSAGIDAQEFATLYETRYHSSPSYVGTKFYESAILAVEAIRNADLQLTPATHDDADLRVERQRNREAVYQALSKINNRQNAPRGLTGPLYFNATRDANQPVRIAQFQQRKLVSAPAQFETVFNPERIDVQHELQAGNLLQIGNDYFWRQQVVYTGIEVNKLSRVDQKSSSFNANFYLWFRYSNSANRSADVTDIEFPGGKKSFSDKPVFNAAALLETDTIDGLNYRLYQLDGEFKSRFDLHNYPFDQQNLTIRFENLTTPSDRLIYAIDTFGLRLPISNTAVAKKPYELPLWKFKSIQYAKEAIRTTSTEGNPQFFNAENRVDYPGLSVTMTLQRRSLIFLVKNLLPLMLLALVPMMTLYFPTNLVKERPPVAVSGIITGVVLLVGANNQLPEVGYTTALEYVFYLFFGLTLFTIVVGIVSDRLLLNGKKLVARRVDIAARILYVVAVLVTIAIYWFIFRTV